VLLELALCIARPAFLGSDGFRRIAHSATATIRAFACAGNGIAANGTFETVCAFLPSWFASVCDGMAVGAQGEAINDRVGEMGMGGHFFDVVGL